MSCSEKLRDAEIAVVAAVLDVELAREKVLRQGDEDGTGQEGTMVLNKEREERILGCPLELAKKASKKRGGIEPGDAIVLNSEQERGLLEPPLELVMTTRAEEARDEGWKRDGLGDAINRRDVSLVSSSDEGHQHMWTARARIISTRSALLFRPQQAPSITCRITASAQHCVFDLSKRSASWKDVSLRSSSNGGRQHTVDSSSTNDQQAPSITLETAASAQHCKSGSHIHRVQLKEDREPARIGAVSPRHDTSRRC
ncbi:hypothetical protein CC86DRAFT_377140 [Ophiobolus disseminans]|uniref:Uncharacterized protein n=1 Tax=Ophiobolus disseminans TaxID=1469910 RepID=A0A6A7AFI1_9PLEO|nr:hypothetical protein CC86DRAFT_377140 [Ophiobolus disseminans]